MIQGRGREAARDRDQEAKRERKEGSGIRENERYKMRRESREG